MLKQLYALTTRAQGPLLGFSKFRLTTGLINYSCGCPSKSYAVAVHIVSFIVVVYCGSAVVYCGSAVVVYCGSAVVVVYCGSAVVYCGSVVVYCGSAVVVVYCGSVVVILSHTVYITISLVIVPPLILSLGFWMTRMYLLSLSLSVTLSLSSYSSLLCMC